MQRAGCLSSDGDRLLVRVGAMPSLGGVVLQPHGPHLAPVVALRKAVLHNSTRCVSCTCLCALLLLYAGAMLALAAAPGSASCSSHRPSTHSLSSTCLLVVLGQLNQGTATLTAQYVEKRCCRLGGGGGGVVLQHWQDIKASPQQRISAWRYRWLHSSAPRGTNFALCGLLCVLATFWISISRA